MEITTNQPSIEQAKDTPRDQFRNGIQRIVTRSEIYRQLGQGLPLSEIKEHVREYVDRVRPDLLADELIEGATKIDRRLYDTLRGLKDVVSEKHKGIRAVVLTGSLANYGNEVRDAIGGQEKKPDLDWGVVYDPYVIPFSNQIGSVLNREAAGYLEENGLESCLLNNPTSLHVPVLTDGIKALGYLDEIANVREGEYSTFRLDALMIYFQPTVPSFVGEDNVEKIFFALKKLAVSDRKKWETVTNKMKSSWVRTHRLLEKHLRFKEYGLKEVDTVNDRDKQLRQKIADLSVEVMGQTFGEVLNFTGNPRILAVQNKVAV